MKKILEVIGIFLFSLSVWGEDLESLADKALDAGFPLAAAEFMAQKINQGNGHFSASSEKILVEIMKKAGTRSFDVIPEQRFDQFGSNTFLYMRAKKKIAKGKYSEALENLRRINSSYEFSPYVEMLKGNVAAILGDVSLARNSFDECISDLKGKGSSISSNWQERRAQFAHDSCVVGKARLFYSEKKYKEAELAFLDLPKSSGLWPDLLFEEAWNSFYEGNYNRTLGKLVTYKAPLLDFVFNPESDVLMALSYFKLCLWDDVKATVDNFYSKYTNRSQELKKLLQERRNDYKYYYQLLSDSEKRGSSFDGPIGNLLKYALKSPQVMEIKYNLEKATDEYNAAKNSSMNPLVKKEVITALSQNVSHQRDYLGAAVRKIMLHGYAQFYKAFQDMSYLKLEMLAQKKMELYTPTQEAARERGDIQYLQRNEKQYFWNFNGEFWADELGDYVFALRSEC